jgi:DUF4097 and DUF4098 domain-containing protein YvlB
MKIVFFVLIFASLAGGSAYCNGIMEMELVNEQKIELDNIDIIEILYHSEEIVLLKSSTDSLIIKEYMNSDNDNFYAKITNLSNKLTIISGHHLAFRLFYILRARIEVYIPELAAKELTIKTTSGNIVAAEEYSCSKINMTSVSGSIAVNTITADMVNASTISGSIRCDKIAGNITAQTTSGNISLGIVEGDVSAKSPSGHIELNRVMGAITAETTSGRIQCSTAEKGGNISLVSISGSIHLGIPQNNIFTFSSRTIGGTLSTPFSDKLFTPLSDRRSVQGAIGGENGQIITIRTTSGPIKVYWVN